MLRVLPGRDLQREMVTNMPVTNDHGACVDAWMERAAKGQPPEQVVRALERGFDAIWRRVRPTIGEPTLRAIADRVLTKASQELPLLEALKVEESGLRAEALRARAPALPPAQLTEGVRLVLVELLTVLGRLTSEMLTPALHGELLKAAPRAGALEREGGGGARA